MTASLYGHRPRPVHFEAIAPALRDCHNKISKHVQSGERVWSNDPAVRAWQAHGEPVEDGWIEFRLCWLDELKPRIRLRPDAPKGVLSGVAALLLRGGS